MKFDLHQAMQIEPNMYDFEFLRSLDHKTEATVFKSNQAIKLDLEKDAEVVDEAYVGIVTIVVLDGEVVVTTKNNNTYELSSKSKDSMIVNLRAPYTMCARQNSKVMVMFRKDNDFVLNKNEELYRRLA